MTEPARILIVDDHMLAREGLRAILGAAGFEVVGAASSAEDALQMAADLQPDVIMMDIRLGPGMDGLEATRRIRQEALNGATPVIALTANALDLHRAAWDAAGVHAFLTKPIDPVLLATTLAEACAVGRQEAGADAAVA